jgi:NADPH2:quinone reductase
MRAAFYTRPGAASEVIEIGELPKPVPGAGEVLVRVHASGVNPSDWKNRRRPLPAPLIVPHSDGAGVIEAVGPDVSRERVGERVWMWNAQWQRAFGTAAEYVALASEQAVPLPAHVSFAEGACLGIPLFTALHAVRLAHPVAGKRVLVAGGAGAVGHYAIQLLKLRGSEVIATVSSALKARHAAQAGADHVIDYREEDVGAKVATITGGAGVDAVLEVDLAGNAKLYPKVLASGCHVVVYGASAAEATVATVPLIQKAACLQFFRIYDIPARHRCEELAEIGDLLESARLQHTIGETLALKDTARAHEIVESGQVLGNVVLAI